MGAAKMREAIWDKTTARQLAWVDDGMLFDLATEKRVGTMRDGALYSLGGELVCHLEIAGQVHEPGSKTPDAFLELLKSAS